MTDDSPSDLPVHRQEDVHGPPRSGQAAHDDQTPAPGSARDVSLPALPPMAPGSSTATVTDASDWYRRRLSIPVASTFDIQEVSGLRALVGAAMKAPKPDAEFLDGVADFYESHGRDEGGYSPETRAEFEKDANRIRAIARSLVERDEGYRAHAASFGALQAISMLTDLEGEVDDYAEIVRAVERLRG